MAGIPFLHNIDLNENQLLNAKLHTSGTAPTNPGTGTIWYDSTNDKVKVYTTTPTPDAWITVGLNTEEVQDIVGAMFTSNTETGIAATYEDGDGTIDLVVGNATSITVADTTDTSCFVGLWESATGDLAPRTDAGITYNAGTGILSATGFSGPLTGNADTATALATARAFTTTGDVVLASVNFDGSGNFTTTATIQANAVEGSMLNNNIISGQTELASGLASTDELAVSDAGTLKRMDVSVLQSYLQSNLTFTTNTNTGADMTEGTLRTKLAAITENVTIGDANDVQVTIAGNLVVSGTTTTVNSTTVTLNDHNIVLDTGNNTSAVVDGAGITLEGGSGSDVTWMWNASGTAMELKLGSSLTAAKFGNITGTLVTASQTNITAVGTLSTLTVDNVIINGTTIGHTGDTDLMTLASGVLTVAGEVDATSLDISGDADIDGTLEADAITVDGTALNTVIDNRIKVIQKTATIDVSSLHSTALKCNIAHGMISNNLIVKLYDGTTFLDVFADIDRTDNNTLQITFASEPTNDIVVIIQEIIGDNIAAGGNITYPSS